MKAVIGALQALSTRKKPAPRLQGSANLLMLLRLDRTGTIGRSKTYYHQWYTVLRVELLSRFRSDKMSMATADPLTSDQKYGVILRGHSLGTERLSGSKTFLYKATLQQLRDIEDRLVLFKVGP